MVNKSQKLLSIKLNKNNLFGLLFFALAIIFKGLGDAIFIKSDPNSPFNYVKYLFLILSFIFFFLTKREKKSVKFVFELKTLLFCYFLIFIISIFFSIYFNMFTIRTLKEFCFILIPIVFVFTAINSLTFKEIEFMAKFSIIVYFISYLIEVGSNFSFSIAIEAIKHFSILGGQASFLYDSLESSAFPDVMMSLFCFFAYYSENNKKWLWLSFIGILLMNKRLIILSACLIMIIIHLPFLKKMIRLRFNKKIYLLPALIFSLSPFLILFLTQDNVENYIFVNFGFNMRDFWMGRDNMVRYLLNNNFHSYGLGSTYDFRDKLLEIECLKFYFETGIIGSFIISFSYWKITKNHIFSLIVMFYIFLNMNTSTSIITGAFAWIFYLLLIGGLNENVEKD